jgi:hypothetical protein
MNTIQYDIADEARIIQEMKEQGFILTANRKLRSGNFMTFQKDRLYDLEKRVKALEDKLWGTV